MLVLILLGLALLSTTFVCIVLRISYCLPKEENQNYNEKPIPTMVIFGSGGHTTEMLQLIKLLDCTKYSPVYFITAHSDHTSIGKIRNAELSYIDQVQWLSIYRSREVKQSWISTIFSTAYAIFQAFKIVYMTQPRIIICNGPGTCVPLCIVAFFYRVIGIFKFTPHIIFVESFCRVTSLSLSGKILYPIASKFIVQWPQLASSFRYPKAKFIGKIC